VKSTKSVRSSIFRSFTLLILAALSLLLLFFDFFISSILRERAASALADSASSMARSIDTEIAEMSNISLSVSGSGLLKRLFAEHDSIGRSGAGSGARLEAYLSARRITDLVVTIIGPLKPVPQVNLYDLAGGMIGAGTASGFFPRRLADMPWYPDLDQRWGAKLITAPDRDPLLDDLFPLYRARSYVSLCRSFFNEARGLIGVVEVKQFYDEIFKDLSGRQEFVAVLDQEGRQIYPFSPAEGGGWAAAAGRVRRGEASTVELANGRVRAVAIAEECKQMGWRVVAARRESDFLRPVAQIGLLGGLVTLLILAASALAVSRLALRITTPIDRMRSALSTLELGELAGGSPLFPPAGLDELEGLEAAFAEMQRKLHSSMSDALEAKTHETRATMLALQSQMDPHFIYNMLTTISIMAEERRHDSIKEAIGHLAHLLRYISSGSSSFVTLEAEVEYARRYLACMKIRFGEGLEYSISLPRELSGIVVPKLILQPLVENCMKYGINREPPLRVDIAVTEGEGWLACVRDDGPGFTGEALEYLNAPAPGEDGALLEIGGLGLRNIAARMRLHYSDQAVFRAENSPEGGASVTIGGSRGRT